LIPIQLNWRRRSDGFELKVFQRSDGSAYKVAQPRSTRTDPIFREAINLEDPVALHFVNCNSDRFIAFLDRFGSLEGEINKSGIDPALPMVRNLSRRGRSRAAVESETQSRRPLNLDELENRRAVLSGNIAMTNPMAKTDPTEKVRYLNKMIDTADAIVWPSFVYSEGSMRFVLKADTLYDFMVMEVAAIHEAGASATSCEHCHRMFLTGPLTGRRSHARYCSDRCRVAAMRVRNAAKED
jgi:hypothetical protein